MSTGGRPIGAAKGKQSDTKANPPPPPKGSRTQGPSLSSGTQNRRTLRRPEQCNSVGNRRHPTADWRPCSTDWRRSTGADMRMVRLREAKPPPPSHASPMGGAVQPPCAGGGRGGCAARSCHRAATSRAWTTTRPGSPRRTCRPTPTSPCLWRCGPHRLLPGPQGQGPFEQFGTPGGGGPGGGSPPGSVVKPSKKKFFKKSLFFY